MSTAIALMAGMPETVEAHAAAILRNVTVESERHCCAFLDHIRERGGTSLVSALSSRFDGLLVQVTGLVWNVASCGALGAWVYICT